MTIPLYPRGGIAEPGTTLNYHTGTWRLQRPVHQHGLAPCHGACPAGEDPQAYLALVDEGRWQEAWQTLVTANPLPAVTGRVCPHPCESSCNRGQYDEAIAIHAVERFLGEQALAEGWAYPIAPLPADAPQVAIVGAGPAGVACGYHLLRLGLRVTLFDALPEAGGLLRTALPPYRLPRPVLNAELERVLACGIRFLPRHRLGRDMSLDELRRDYAAVFLAPGQQLGHAWDVAGVTPRDLHQGLDLLKEYHEVGTLPSCESAAVIGAGNTAVDIARILKRAGAREVHIISHKLIPAPGVPAEDTMPALAREIEQALEEGVIIHQHRGVHRLLLRGERVVGLELVHMKKLLQASGRWERVEFEGTESVLHVQQVIPAVGQIVDPEGMEALLNGAPALRTDAWGRLAAWEGVYAGGDAAGKAGTVTAAVGQGRRAAQAIAAQVRQVPLESPPKLQEVRVEQLNLHYYEHLARAKEAVLPVAERQGEIEIELGLARNEVRHEARRCFSCGNCLACDNCWTLCPDSAVLKTTELARDGSHYVFDYDYCKGCGLCASECPCGYIAMAKDA